MTQALIASNAVTILINKHNVTIYRITVYDHGKDFQTICIVNNIFAPKLFNIYFFID